MTDPRILQGQNAKKKSLGQIQQSVEEIIIESFRTQAKRITKNSLLKCFDYFLVQMSKSVSRDIQGEVALMSDQKLSEMFDLDITIKRLKEEERRLEELVEKDTETAFMNAASRFRF